MDDLSSVASGESGEDRSSQLVAISIVFMALTTVVLGLRFYAKRFQDGGFFSDDAFLSSAYVVNLGMCALGIVMTKVGGVGRHVTFLEKEMPEALVGWAQCLFAFEIIYFTSVALPKLSILCLYLRLFNWTGRMRTMALIVFSLTAMTSVSLVVAACFQCRPIQFWWDRTIPGGYCFDIQAFFHAQAIPGLFLDMAIMALPLSTIWRLKLPMIKRLALIGIFAVASFGIISSMVRAAVFFGTAAFDDRTWASVDLVGWSIIETSVYIITGCLPHLKPLASQYTPKWVKNAVKHAARTLSQGSNSKGWSGRYGLKSFVSTKKSAGQPIERQEDDAIELTRQSSAWSRGLSTTHVDGGGLDPTHSRFSPQSGQFPGETSSKEELGGLKGDLKRNMAASHSSYGEILVTREVKLTRS